MGKVRTEGFFDSSSFSVLICLMRVAIFFDVGYLYQFLHHSFKHLKNRNVQKILFLVLFYFFLFVNISVVILDLINISIQKFVFSQIIFILNF